MIGGEKDGNSHTPTTLQSHQKYGANQLSPPMLHIDGRYTRSPPHSIRTATNYNSGIDALDEFNLFGAILKNEE